MTDDAVRGISLEVLGTDLYGIAATLATLTRGMVSIEDDRSRVLAYSASDDTADELRRLSILGREGPPAYLKRLRDWGIFDRLRLSDEVIEVPPDPEVGIRRRLVVSIRSAGPAGHLGTIWVQEGGQPLAPDSAEVLRGASVVAARMITRTINAPSAEAVQIERLLGGRGGGVDVPSLAAALSIPTTGPAVVIGFAAARGETLTGLDGLASTLRLHAGAYAKDALVSPLEDRVYLLMPRSRSVGSVTTWTNGVIKRIAKHSGIALRAAIAAPVSSLSAVSAARIEVDRVLDQTSGDQQVTTLADSRTPVLLGEILDLIAEHDQLRDPRIDALVAYDARYAAEMRRSVETYLQHFGDVRGAAAELQIHPNTLRYRIRRAEEILDIDLGEPAGRLLVELQLAVLRRSMMINGAE